MKFLAPFLFLLPCVTVAMETSTLVVTPIAEHVYKHESSLHVEPWGLVAGSGLIVVDGQDAYIVDTPWTEQDTEALLLWAEDRKLNIKGAVVTHYHQDASGGLAVLNKHQIPTYASAQTNHLLAQKHSAIASHNLPQASAAIKSGVVETYYPGAGHSKDNIVVWLPQSKILFAGCFVKSVVSKNLGNLEDASVDEWQASIHKVLSRYPEANMVIPGHGKEGDLSLLHHTVKLIKIEQSKGK
ncbi:subclass B1 metallo-beta-lactamase [Pseudoalteromonas sp. A22]|uniref:subclass B1 metallo-beta-lactamase n=1 Tax=Pseudoalteromonas sp. A22 TaxID=327511 RepID=UPI001BA78D60|nr:subclass B1 metallo-beta-lactamase [Pseudoalteromonas sp. A22]QUI64316.1 subclass B1 metallo-beta-lactamase [Pseudoalteromonas sp. A22]